jgi:hypothetical protein
MLKPQLRLQLLKTQKLRWWPEVNIWAKELEKLTNKAFHGL